MIAWFPSNLDTCFIGRHWRREVKHGDRLNFIALKANMVTSISFVLTTLLTSSINSLNDTKMKRTKLGAVWNLSNSHQQVRCYARALSDELFMSFFHAVVGAVFFCVTLFTREELKIWYNFQFLKSFISIYNRAKRKSHGIFLHFLKLLWKLLIKLPA